jgi:hypothetical protein
MLRFFHITEYTFPTPICNSLAICLIPIPFSRSNFTEDRIPSFIFDGRPNLTPFAFPHCFLKKVGLTLSEFCQYNVTLMSVMYFLKNA